MPITPVLLVAIALQTGPVPAADRGASAAYVTGRVTERDSGRPVEGARVRIVPGTSRADGEATTDADGRYRLGPVPSGSVVLQALGPSRSARYSDDPTVTSTQRVTIVPGADASADLKLTRAYALSGRLTNAAGEGLEGFYIKIHDAASGRLVQINMRTPTDDRGQFRVFGLAPGHYVICADPPGFGDGDARYAGPPRLRYPTACHPSARTVAQAGVVRLADRDVENIHIVAQPVPTFTVSGRFVDAGGGKPDGLRLWFERFTRFGSNSGGPLVVDSDGRFTVSGVPPGQYGLRAGVAGPQERHGPGAFVPFTVSSADVHGLVLTPASPHQVRGRLVFSDGTPPRLARVTVRGRVPGVDWRRVVVTNLAVVQPDHGFLLEQIRVPVVVDVDGIPAGWAVREIRYKGRDVAHELVDLRSGPEELEIILTSRGAILAGRVVDDAGAPAGGRVLLFPADARRRAGTPWELMRTANATTGRFTFPMQLEGDYFVVAVDGHDLRHLHEESGFERLTRDAQRITLIPGDRREVELRVVRER